MNILKIKSVENSELVDQAFLFWFSDDGHLRSPFPTYIQDKLRPQAIEKFHAWINRLKEEAKDELNEEMVAEKLEEIIFETALPLVLTEDEKITILYPFLPRLGDIIRNDFEEENVILDRFIKKDGDHSYLEVKCTNLINGKEWKTSFELPL